MQARKGQPLSKYFYLGLDILTYREEPKGWSLIAT